MVRGCIPRGFRWGVVGRDIAPRLAITVQSPKMSNCTQDVTWVTQ
jgi:hypothetical protein